MKKKLLIYAVLTALTLSFAACGQSKPADSTPSVAEATATPTAEPTPEPTEAPTPEPTSEATAPAEPLTEKFPSMQKMLEDPTVQAEIENSLGNLGDNMKLEVIGENEKLIYRVQILDLGGVDRETMASAMENAFSGMQSFFTSLADSLRDAVDVETPVVVVDILDPDGESLCTLEYPAE